MNLRQNIGASIVTAVVAMSMIACKQSVERPSEIGASSSTFRHGPDKPQEFDFAKSCTDIAACKKMLHGLPRGFGTVRNLPTATIGESTAVLIVAYDGSRHLSPKNPPKQPTLLAHIENLGTASSTVWSLQPVKDAEYDITLQDDAGAAKWTLWEITTAGRTATYHGTYKDCGHKNQWTVSLADWANCDTSPGNDAASSTPMITSSMSMFGGVATTLGKYLAMFQGPDDPAWISCSAGCCTIDKGEQKAQDK